VKCVVGSTNYLSEVHDDQSVVFCGV
jgi:hypothetical protein